MKEYIKDNAINFFIIVTMVNIAMFVCGTILAPDQVLHYNAFLVPVIDGLLGVIPGLVMYSKRELSVKQMIVRNIIQFLSVELIVVVFTFGFSKITSEKIPYLIGVVLCVAFVYAAVLIIRYLLDMKTARQLNDELKAFQES